VGSKEKRKEKVGEKEGEWNFVCWEMREQMRRKLWVGFL
jgi:hypothetical protein